jgi:hypothetical protein
MSSSFFHPRRMLVAAALAAAVSVTGCSDATDPSAADGTGSEAPVTHAPASTSTPADAGSQLPMLEKAPAELKLPAPGETAKPAVGFNPLVVTASSYDRRYSTGPGYVRIPAGSAQCSSFYGIRFVNVRGINVSVSGGTSALWSQSVAQEVWLYRWNGASWVYAKGVRTDTSLGATHAFATLKDAWFSLASGGTYRVVVRFTWFANGGGGWVTAASKTYDFNGQAEYTVSSGGSTGAGYCRIN